MAQLYLSWVFTLKTPNQPTRKTPTPMFIISLLIEAKSRNQPRTPTPEEWVKKMCHIRTMEVFSHNEMGKQL